MSAAAYLVFSLAALAAGAGLAWVGRAFVRAGGRPTRWTLAAALAVGAGSLGVYLFSGQPSLAGAPAAPRLAAIEARLKAEGAERLTRDEALALLYAQARRHPLDPRPRAFAGQLLLEMERPQDAARLLEAALRRNPDDAVAALDLARASAQMNGVAHQGTQALFARAAMLDPQNPVPWIYRGLAAQAENRPQDAAAAWRGVLERVPEDDPRRQMAQQMLGQALGGAQPEAKQPS